MFWLVHGRRLDELILSVGDVVLADRTSEEYFEMFVQLCQAGRRWHCKRTELTERELTTVDRLLTRFHESYFKHLYAGNE